MSENEIEDNDKALVETDVLETESIEPEVTQPSTQKKGSFLGFLTFIFSLAALALSAYMYYQQYLSSESQITENPWQQDLTKLQSQLNTNTDKIQSLSDQLATLSITNTTQKTGAQSFDDSKLNENIAQLQSQLSQQNNQLNELNQQQTDLKQTNQQQKQALKQFKQRYEKDKSKQPAVIENSIDIDPLQKQKAIAEDLIASYLLTAHKDLNISGNVNTATKSLNMAVTKLKELSDSKFQSLIEDIQSTSRELNGANKVDVFGLNQGIDALQFSVNKLAFVSAQEPEEKPSSWYDNLVKIKKIDDSEKQLLTQSEQSSIRQSLKLHFDLLRSALISQNLGLWVSEIEAIQTLVKKHFAETKDSLQYSILRQLGDLKLKNIDPTWPDLSIYLQKFNALLNIPTAGE